MSNHAFVSARGGADIARAARTVGAARASSGGARSVSFALATMLLLACAPDTSPERIEVAPELDAGEVAIDFTGPNDAALIVPVFINGDGPFDLVLDTGATITCLSHETAERLGLSAEPGAVGFGAGVGGAGRFEVVRVDSLRVGGTTAHNLLACTLDLSQLEAIGTEIDGLLGLNFLREFRITIDFERNVLRLE
jgi:predicted aspartyl protease